MYYCGLQSCEVGIKTVGIRNFLFVKEAMTPSFAGEGARRHSVRVETESMHNVPNRGVALHAFHTCKQIIPVARFFFPFRMQAWGVPGRMWISKRGASKNRLPMIMIEGNTPMIER